MTLLALVADRRGARWLAPRRTLAHPRRRVRRPRGLRRRLPAAVGRRDLRRRRPARRGLAARRAAARRRRLDRAAAAPASARRGPAAARSSSRSLGALVAIGIQAAERFTAIAAPPPRSSRWSRCSPWSPGWRSPSARTSIDLEASHPQALTDPLTGLGNRRQLTDRAGRRRPARRAPGESAAGGLRPRRLQGLQRHLRAPGRRRAAARLGGRARRLVGARGEAYRLGGDEFCVLARHAPRREVDGLVAGAPPRWASAATASCVTASRAASCSPARRATRGRAAARRPADVREQEPRAGLGRHPDARRPAERAARARARTCTSTRPASRARPCAVAGGSG